MQRDNHMKKIIISFVLLLAADKIYTMSMTSKRERTEKPRKISIEAQQSTEIDTNISRSKTDSKENKNTTKKNNTDRTAEEDSTPSKKTKLEAEKRDTFNT